MKAAWARKKAANTPIHRLRLDGAVVANKRYHGIGIAEQLHQLRSEPTQGQFSPPPQQPYPTLAVGVQVGAPPKDSPLAIRTDSINRAFSVLRDVRQTYVDAQQRVTGLDPQSPEFGQAIEDYHRSVNNFLDALAAYFVIANL